jgi:hypothetical protein
MKQMSQFIRIRVVLALLLGIALPVVSPAWAQNPPWKSGDFKMETGGSGEIRTRRSDDRIDRTVVNLRRNGRADITFYMNREQVKFDGKWSEDRLDSQRARLNLELRGNYSSFNGDVDGTLTLERVVIGLVDSWRVRRVELSGREGNNRLSVDFDGGRSDNGGGNNDNEDYNGGSGDFQDYSGETRGDGRIRDGRNDRDINRANIRLARGGYADITFYGDATTRVIGRWRSVGDNRAEIRIDRLNGSNANRGEGQLEFRRRNGRNLELRRVNFDGRTSNGEFSVDFSVGRNDGGDDNNGGGGNSNGIDSNQRGRGTLRTANQGNIRLSRASVNLDKNGRAQILVEASNGTRYTVSGRWTRGRDREFNITVSAALSYNNATGRGKITLRNDREFSKIDLSGTFGSRDWSIDFDAD